MLAALEQIAGVQTLLVGLAAGMLVVLALAARIAVRMMLEDDDAR